MKCLGVITHCWVAVALIAMVTFILKRLGEEFMSFVYKGNLCHDRTRTWHAFIFPLCKLFQKQSRCHCQKNELWTAPIKLNHGRAGYIQVLLYKPHNSLSHTTTKSKLFNKGRH